MSAADDVLQTALGDSAPGLPLAVAYSGGADSTALLHACAQRWPGQVLAVHVNHQLQAAADDFEARARATCAALGVPLRVCRVDARPRPGDSPEDAARRARHAALADALAREDAAPWGGRPVRDLALAHHADDQLETLLMALSRGAGLPGLAAMPARAQRGEITWHRPWLRLSRDQLRDWLRQQGIGWIEDPTNAQPDALRNRLRQQLMPALLALWPALRDTAARSAAHAAQAQGLLDEMAAADLLAAGVPPRIDALRALNPARRANLLRHWLRRVHGQQASAAQLDELVRQIDACRTRGHGIALKVAQGRVERRGEHLDWYTP